MSEICCWDDWKWCYHRDMVCDQDSCVLYLCGKCDGRVPRSVV